MSRILSVTLGTSQITPTMLPLEPEEDRRNPLKKLRTVQTNWLLTLKKVAVRIS